MCKCSYIITIVFIKWFTKAEVIRTSIIVNALFISSLHYGGVNLARKGVGGRYLTDVWV